MSETNTTTTPAPLLPGITSTLFDTERLRTHALTSGDPAGAPVVFVHGNASASRFWEETLIALPPGFFGIAPDFRSFGDSEGKGIDATRGLRDFSDDLYALLTSERLGVADRKVHLVGWSVGGGVVMQYAIDHPERVASLTLVAPMSPYGFGGTKGAEGTPISADFAGSGGATANPEFVKRIGEKDASEDSDFSPRKVMNAFYFKPPFRASKEREDVFVAEVLKTRVGDDAYPGDSTTTTNWPCVAPGKRGMNNALSPAYVNLSSFSKISPMPNVLWIRGANDQIVSDTSLFDLAFLGQLGAVPGWPGADFAPPQPMIAQTRAVLDAYSARGGSVREEVLPDVGHSPLIEAPEAFRKHVFDHIANAANAANVR